MLPTLPRVFGGELYEVFDIVREKRPALFYGVLQDFGVVRFAKTFRNDGHNVEAAFSEHFGEKGTDVLVK
jgi:hypothetical protein